MLISDVWAELAQTHAIEPSPGADQILADIVLAGPQLPATAYDVTMAPAPLHPSRVHRYAHERQPPAARQLVVTMAATPAAIDAARDIGVSVLVAPDHEPISGVLIDLDDVAHVITPPAGSASSAEGSRRASWGRLALVLALLNDPTPRTQAELARETGLSQARVSQAFAQMRDLVERRNNGWTARRDAAASWVATTYPHPTTTAAWLSLDAPIAATKAVVECLRDARVDYAITGQVAADLYAPWARPDRTIIWAERLIDLRDAGCTPVPAAEATVTVAVPDDPRALTLVTERDGLRLADPWRVWITLMQHGDTDAAEHLHARLLAPTDTR